MNYRSRHSVPLPALPRDASSATRTRPSHRVRARTPGPRLLTPADTPLRLALRATAALIFFVLGYLKFFEAMPLGTDAVSLPVGVEGFGMYLAAIGVPFPLFNAYLVCLVEMICGTGLLLSAFLPAPALLTRLNALPLFVAMTVAIVTVGLGNALGDPVTMNGIAVTEQAWRLPVEVVQWLITLLLLWRPVPLDVLSAVPVPERSS
ncbi:DoxX family protein [Pyxidicoccus xibeiensis]|uniref:DoxX family protein n=1 Tax=Pyxidicoccus xibeiensis TaxID=2906759 RepID=UPI0020A7AB42|nr:DoxX family protein [Pyxidicoccus xibeiensis]MCP3138020.1 DoxX family protein [Pyxidicoccus xibeiensis]